MADWSTCPQQPGPQRDEWILDAIRNGEGQARWEEISIETNGHTASFFVLADALMIEGVRINVSADLQQRIADVLGCLLLTPQLADMIWAARSWTVPPYTIPPVNGGIPMDTATMIAQSRKIDDALEAQGYDGTGIVQTTGKHWILGAPSAAKARNYGWHFTGSAGYAAATPYAKGARVWQQPGTAHNAQHVDYSQVCVLVARNCTVDGHADFDLGDVLQSDQLWPLASYEGPVNQRQPGVNEEEFGGSSVLPLPPHVGGGSSGGAGGIGGLVSDISETVEKSPLLSTALVVGTVSLTRHYAPDILRFLGRMWRRVLR